jgi:hypothetical protein
MKAEFSYTLEKQDIIDYMRLSVEEKLQWLEDMAEFSEMALSDEAKRVRERFRSQ